jgi:hypothetical protein
MDRSGIHLLHKRGKSLRAIAAELGHSKTTIARALSEPVDQQPAHRARVSLVDPWRDQIAEWLRQGLSGVRMLELARDDLEQPYRGGDSVWRARSVSFKDQSFRSGPALAPLSHFYPGIHRW